MKKLILFLLFGALLTSCGPSGEEVMRQENLLAKTSVESANETSAESAVEGIETGIGQANTVNFSDKPNEAGDIMVLMYHNIGPEEAEWVRTPENFKKDLQHLYDKGYRPISLEDYVTGNITTPSGLTPYVLTFDDGRENNFRYLADGSIDPDCAVGILMDFAKNHSDFKPHATFFINGYGLFEQEGREKEKFDFLVANGMAIGNHTVGHPDMSDLSAEDVQQEIGQQKNYLETFFSNPYNVNTLALPYGSRPSEPLYPQLAKGTYDGKTYENIAILNVGWDPYFSPFHTDFDPEHIHRVRASETNVDNVGMYDWLENFELKPEKRFISDGIPTVVTVPEDLKDTIKLPTDKELVTY